ncbi:hypothetical protein HHI36_016663, partial [Cryptolaemus montrouzieri]
TFVWLPNTKYATDEEGNGNGGFVRAAFPPATKCSRGKHYKAVQRHCQNQSTLINSMTSPRLPSIESFIFCPHRLQSSAPNRNFTFVVAEEGGDVGYVVGNI